MSRQPSKRNATTWQIGRSGNPNGRPRTGLAFAEAVRERLDPHVVLDLVERHLADEEIPIAARLAAVLPFLHSGFIKPPTEASLSLSVASQTARDFSHISVERRLELIAEIDGPTTLDAPTDTVEQRLCEPLATDDNT